MNPPQIIEFDSESVLLGWEACPHSICYELQMTTHMGDDPVWISLSNSLSQTLVRKKNLSPGLPHRFRVNCKFPYGWDIFSPPSSEFIPPPLTTHFPSAPMMISHDETSISLEWSTIENSRGYTLRYRKEHDLAWETVSSVIPSNAVRKKNLSPGHNYCFSIRPIVDNEEWEFSPSSPSYSVQELSKAVLHHATCGYTTTSGRLEYLQLRGISSHSEHKKISESLTADPNLDAPLYYWQLYSILGTERIFDLVTTFYESVYGDYEEAWFRTAFARLSDKDHHIQTQAAYWIDAMGGGKYYHGGDYRLNFHHTHNAGDVMSARGAKRWMHHMKLAIVKHSNELCKLDRRIVPCLLDFLKVKMLKYSREHGWDFDGSDFDDIAELTRSNRLTNSRS